MYLQQDIEGGRRNLAIGEPLASGGEARIYSVRDDPALVAKVYHQPSRERSAKLSVMVSHPPAGIEAQGHASIAWPMHLLRRDNSVVGFVMPRARGMHPVFEFYNPKSRREQTPHFSYFYLLRAARNLAAAVNSLHAAGYVIGDVNESNILVNDRALVTLVDTDSFQVRDPASPRLYRCQVGKAEFTPPELQGVLFSEITRAPEHDLFGLGVLVFQMLMEGTHPFAGRYTGNGEPPAYEERIARGHFPYAQGLALPFEPMPFAPPLAVLHPPLVSLFERCFVQGHHRPSLRPTADEWQKALVDAEEQMAVCTVNPQHRFGFHLSVCPWCQRRTQLGGHDPFPAPGFKPRKAPIKKRPPVPNLTSARPVRRQVTTTTPTYHRSPSSGGPSGWQLFRGGAGWIIWLIFMAVTKLGSCNSTPSYQRSTPSMDELNRHMEELKEKLKHMPTPAPKQSGGNRGLDENNSRPVIGPVEHVYDGSGLCIRCKASRFDAERAGAKCWSLSPSKPTPVTSDVKLEKGSPQP